jgi:CRISPR-associated protein Csx3
MATYNIIKEGDILRISFGTPAQNDQIVRDAFSRLKEMKDTGELPGGKIIKLNGPASLPVAVLIGHELAHLYETIAVYDPKIGKYVVSISHGPDYTPGDLIE